MRHKDIYGHWIGDAIGYCNCKYHPGAINRKIVKEKHCDRKHCKYLAKFDNWHDKQRYKNRKR